MIVMYWKVRGFGKSETKVTLKNLYVSHKPVVIFLVEPLSYFSRIFMRTGVDYLGLDLRRWLLFWLFLSFADFVGFPFFSFFLFRGFWSSPPSCIFPPFLNKI